MRRMILFTAAAAVMWCACGAFGDADKKGAVPGRWTMDLDAARKAASEKKLPILLNFTGSDWCAWCRLMEQNVFSKKEWEDYARDNLLMVFLDFPKDKSAVPADYAERNDQLKERHNVEGFPTFILLDDDAETELGRLGAGQNKTPKSFRAELLQLTRHRTIEMKKYAGTLKPEKKAEYLTFAAQMTECRKSIREQEKLAAAAKKKTEELQEKMTGLKESAAEFRAAQRGADELKKYRQLKKELDAAEKALSEWIAARPQPTPANARKYQETTAKIQELTDKLSEY